MSWRRTVTARATACLAVVGSMTAVCVPIAGGEASSTIAYYVDSVEGNDANQGTSPAAAWRTLSRAQQAPLAPGSTLLFRRGSAWTGKLVVTVSGRPDAPITVGPYGSGAPPRIHDGGCVQLVGSHLVVQGIHVDSCTWSGFSVSGSHNVIRSSVATRNVTGVYVKAGATANRVVSNELRDNNRMSVVTEAPGDDSGAWGVLLRGDENEVAFNVITGSDAFSYDYVRDGAAVELYGGRSNVIHHNVAVDNNMFSELGNSRSAYNVYAYNKVFSTLERGGFLTTRGAASGYGPVMATEVHNNSVLLKGALSEGIVCHAGCGPDILRMRNNVIQAVRKVGYADAPFDDGNGIYSGGRIQFRIGPGSRVAQPQFTDPSLGDLRLLPFSPGVDEGDAAATSFTLDLDGRPVPSDGNGDGVAMVDVGAYELPAEPPARVTSKRWRVRRGATGP